MLVGRAAIGPGNSETVRRQDLESLEIAISSIVGEA